MKNIVRATSEMLWSKRMASIDYVWMMGAFKRQDSDLLAFVHTILDPEPHYQPWLILGRHQVTINRPILRLLTTSWSTFYCLALHLLD